MERKRIKVSDIIKDVESGMKRPEIKEKYKLTGTEMKVVFSHEKLKGIRAKAPETVLIIDDDTENTNEEESVTSKDSNPVNQETTEKVEPNPITVEPTVDVQDDTETEAEGSPKGETEIENLWK